MTNSIGRKLRQAREEQERTLEEAAITTRIRLRYLQAMEDGNFEALPSPFQQRGFLRSYAGFLGLDPAPLLSELAPGKSQTSKTPLPTKKPLPKEAKHSNNELEDIGEKLKTQRNVLGFSLKMSSAKFMSNPAIYKP